MSEEAASSGLSEVLMRTPPQSGSVVDGARRKKRRLLPSLSTCGSHHIEMPRKIPDSPSCSHLTKESQRSEARKAEEKQDGAYHTTLEPRHERTALTQVESQIVQDLSNTAPIETQTISTDDGFETKTDPEKKQDGAYLTTLKPRQERIALTQVESQTGQDLSNTAPRETQTTSTDDGFKTKTDPEVRQDGHRDPILHWATTGVWPDYYAKMNQSPSENLKKRSHSPSYSQSVKDGKKPRAHTPAYQNNLAEHGIFMDDLKGRQFVSEDSKILCTELLRARYEPPQYPSFPEEKFMLAWQQVQNRNEARVFRDLTPLIVPSPEILFLNGSPELEHILEELSANWTQCRTLGGTRPRPDLSVGLSSSAFTKEELSKLNHNTTSERTTIFTEHMYFPFLVCEAKCGAQGINRADRQNAHSASIAVNAMVQLHRLVGADHASQLSRQILVFSISHDNERVKIYGHYALVEGEKTSFYRDAIKSFTLNFDGGIDHQRTYDFVREVYRQFSPKHLARLQSTLAKLDDPGTQLTTSDLSVEDAASQGSDVSMASLQESSSFKKPDVPANKKQKREVALLKKQLAQQEKIFKEQMARQEKQYKEQIELLKGLLTPPVG